jgi:membrane-bound lytic murein transglycosylase D
MHRIQTLCLGALTAGYIGLAGCSGSLRTAATHSGSVVEDTVAQEILEALPDEELAGDSLCSRKEIDSLLERAILAAGDKSFCRADSLLKTAHERLAASCQATGQPPELSPEALNEKLVSVYTDYLPASYLDSMPENLSVMAFRRQLSLSLDSVTLEPQDSAILSSIHCQDATPYNIGIPRNERVTKALVRTARKNRHYLERWLSRAHYYLPVMRQVFADSGLPTDLAYLPLIESGFNPRAYSHAHASGIWQFIASTGKRYGLRRNFWFDERRDPIKATRAAASYLKKLYGDFGDWHLALAAYNCGEGRVAREIKRADTADYWSLRLPRETMNYVPHYLAAVMIAKNPQCWGITAPRVDPFDLDSVTLSDCIDLNKIASALELPFERLKEYNPHLLRWCTPPDVANVTLYIPRDAAAPFEQFYASLTPEDKVKWYRYRIRSGDNLLGIAGRFKLSVQAIKSINKLSTNRIIAGKHLFIPIPVESSIAETAHAARTSATQGEDASKPAGKKILYTVRPGDTVSRIASLFNVSIGQICDWNGISRPGDVRAGRRLTLYAETDALSRAERKEREASAAEAIGPNSVRKTCTVRKGDNLYAISKRVGVHTKQLAAWNKKDIDAPLIYPGETLVYYADTGAARKAAPARAQRAAPAIAAGGSACIRYRVAPGDNPFALSRLFGVAIDTLLAANGLRRGEVIRAGDTLCIPDRRISARDVYGPHAAEVVLYQVRQGDNLWEIANVFGVPVQRLYRANNLGENSVLMPGDTVRIVKTEEL